MRKLLPDNDPLLQRAASLPSDWQPLPHVGITRMQSRWLTYISIALWLLCVALPSLLWQADPIHAAGYYFDNYGVAVSLAVAFAVTGAFCLAHELFHLALHPDGGRSDATIVGIQASMLFVLYDGPMSKRRMVSYLLAPLVGLGVALAFAYAFNPRLWPLLLLLTATHLAMCVGDIFLLYRLGTAGRPFREVWNCGTALMAR